MGYRAPDHRNDTSFVAPLDNGASHSRALGSGINDAATSVPLPAHEERALALVQDTPERGVVIVEPVGGRQVVRPLDPASFPTADTSSLMRG